MKLTLQNTDGVFHLAEYFGVHAVKNSWMEVLSKHYGQLAQSLENNGWKKRTGMTQTDLMLKHMQKSGSISQREAYIDYGIQSFHRRLSDLREQGYAIIGDLKTHPTTGQKYTRYRLGDLSTGQMEFDLNG